MKNINNKQASFNVKVDEDILKQFKQVVKNNGGKIGFETTVALENYIKRENDKNEDVWIKNSEELLNLLKNDINDNLIIYEITKDLDTFKDFINSDRCSFETLKHSQSLVTVNSFDKSEPNFYKLEVSLSYIQQNKLLLSTSSEIK